MLPKAGLYLRTFFVIDQRVICITETDDLDAGRKIGLAPGKLPQPVVSGRCEDIHKAHGAVGHLWLQWFLDLLKSRNVRVRARVLRKGEGPTSKRGAFGRLEGGENQPPGGKGT